MAPHVQVEGLSKRYGGATIFRDVALSVFPREHVVVTGPSGAGKSTLLRIVAGLEVPSSGSVSINRRLVVDQRGIRVPAHRRGVGMVFQELALWPNLTCEGNIALGLTGSHLTRADRHERISGVLRACHIEHLRRRRPETLSSGEQQRIALARTLACQPQVILLDEPFGSLDLLLRQELFQLVRCLCRKHRMTALTVTHDPSDAMGLQADRVLVLEEGTIMDDIRLDELQRRSVQSRTLRAWQALIYGQGETDGPA